MKSKQVLMEKLMHPGYNRPGVDCQNTSVGIFRTIQRDLQLTDTVRVEALITV